MVESNSSDTITTVDNRRDTRWQPGQSGNLKGRPKTNVSITASMRKNLADVIDGKTNADWIAIANIDEAKTKGARNQVGATNTILDRTDGKVTQDINITGSIIHTTPQLELEAQKRLRDAADEERLLIEGEIVDR